MLLETLDIKKNDILIYSQNLLDFEENFKIIYKDNARKEPGRIKVEEVYAFVNEFTPKNLIVYRILTNLKNFDIRPPRYGFFISINNINELIYFDPIFAIKEIEEFGTAGSFYDLRFRIQQVGLTTLNRTGNIANYAELYSVDLQAKEAKYQNDKIIADAILTYIRKGSPVISFLPDIKPDGLHKNGIKMISRSVSEDKNLNFKKIMKINYKGSAGVKNISGLSGEPESEEKAKGLGPPVKTVESKKRGNEFSKFIEKKKTSGNRTGQDSFSSDKKNDKVLNIFKTPQTVNKFIDGRQLKTVILKMDKKD